ncbi:MAG TPA: hypothetical protein VF412_18095 [Bdellovibrio sp.]|uniref:hypothetical protein n=1 Tax=Bdellovibrio sp. TaxID=28201 RepID=UPI002EEBA1BD
MAIAHAESGSCLGKTESGKIVSIQSFTTGYSDNNIDYLSGSVGEESFRAIPCSYRE